MDLSEFYPTPKDLADSELSVLNYLRNSPYIKERHPQVANDAHQHFGRNQASKSSFTFNSHFDVRHAEIPAANNRNADRPNARLIVSALIEHHKKSFTNVSYCLSVCRIRYSGRNANLTVLRKFHFDVVAETKQKRRQEHPRFHLQYCGKMVPYMSELGCRDTQLNEMHPWLSEPRIFYWPMSLALLIDMALHEFPDQHSMRFRSDNYWKGLVHGQETLVLRPFYEKCVQVIRNHGNSNLTLADAFYVS